MKSQQILLEGEVKYNQIEKLIEMNREENILYCTASENGLYILTDKNKFLIYEKNSMIKNYIQLSVMQSIVKKEQNFQTKEKTSKIWCNNAGDHVLIKTDKSLFYYNPYFKNDYNLREINFEFKSKYYVEPYSIAFNEVIKSKEEFEILVTDYFSEIYNVRIKITKKNEIMIDYFEKIFTFKTKFELEEEHYLEKREENEKEKEDLGLDSDFDFDPMELINFEKDERIIDMKMFNNEIGGEKIIIACTKNKIFNFSGKEKTFKEIFNKYITDRELILIQYFK